MRFETVCDFEQWRVVARRLLQAGTSPWDVQLSEDTGQPLLFSSVPDVNTVADDEGSSDVRAAEHAAARVPKGFLELAETVAYHSHPDRWNLLYRLLWRLTHGEPRLLEVSTDDDVYQANTWEKQIRRDSHKMKAFVRFRRVQRKGEEHFVAWYQPDHRIVRRVASFFSRRFPSMFWTIVTPHESVVWNQSELQYGPGLSRNEAPAFDELEDLWRTYYANIFNPARIKIDMMKSEMPVRFWANLPETQIIPDLLSDAPRRVAEMIERSEGFAETAARYLPSEDPPRSLTDLAQRATQCQACDLYCHATQTVFGVGPVDARIVLVGEQPGDQEDLVGQPFVGPAGELLQRAIEAAGLDRSNLYVTNMVKHFKHTVVTTAQGKRRLHQRPHARELRSCRPWFEAEWSFLTKAEVLVCLGATAATAIFGPNFRLTLQRGEFVRSEYCSRTIASWHPAAILRARDEAARELKFQQLLDDLTRVATR